ncbi:MAG TPA: MIP family channel protein [Candidatus Nitrosotalea sp.]|nr:MIP family channel protein [Nitrososphaerota archaeon]HKU33531.1 MIP family channel protein [Candidatus Nitrosotalea sp.]
MVNPRAWFAESIGTFCLVFFGPVAITLSVVVLGGSLTPEGLLVIALAHGAAIGLMVYTFGHVSGGHFNPAVTLSFLATKRIDVKNAAGYIAFQLIGAVIAAAANKAILPASEKVKYGVQTGPSALIGSSATAGFTVEAILTFFLVTVIFMTVLHKKAAAGLYGFAIGGMIFLDHIVGVPLTGASMNPARTFGPALISGYWDYHWIYWAGPIVGGVIAGLIMNYVFIKKSEKEASA